MTSELFWDRNFKKNHVVSLPTRGWLWVGNEQNGALEILKLLYLQLTALKYVLVSALTKVPNSEDIGRGDETWQRTVYIQSTFIIPYDGMVWPTIVESQHWTNGQINFKISVKVDLESTRSWPGVNSIRVDLESTRSRPWDFLKFRSQAFLLVA